MSRQGRNRFLRRGVVALAVEIALAALASAAWGDVIAVAIDKSVFEPAKGEKVTFAAQLDRAGTVTFRVYDTTHSVVRTLAAEVPNESGGHAWTWDGRLEGGQLAVPGTAYYPAIELAGVDGERFVFDPAPSGGRSLVLSERDCHYDAGAGGVMVSLPVPARLLVRAGVKDGPILATLSSWSAFPAGETTLGWDGWDPAHLVDVAGEALHTTESALWPAGSRGIRLPHAARRGSASRHRNGHSFRIGQSGECPEWGQCGCRRADSGRLSRPRRVGAARVRPLRSGRLRRSRSRRRGRGRTLALHARGAPARHRAGLALAVDLGRDSLGQGDHSDDLVHCGGPLGERREGFLVGDGVAARGRAALRGGDAGSLLGAGRAGPGPSPSSRIEGAAAVYGCAFDVVYDPALLSVKSHPAGPSTSFDVSQASFLDGAGTTTTFTLSALEAASPGRLVVGLTRVGGAPGVSSSEDRALVTVGMRAVTAGSSVLLLEHVVIEDGSGNPLPVTTPATSSIEITTAASNRAPRADAGKERVTRPGRPFVLDATRSEDPDADALVYGWRQVSGPSVDLGDVARAAIRVLPPGPGSLAFEVSVSDGALTSRATVLVTVSDSGNTAPRVLANRPSSGTNGVLPVPFILIDAESDPSSVDVAFRVDQTEYRTATPVADGPPLARLATESGGLPYTFLWDSGDDLGAASVPSVWLRFTPRDADGGVAAVVGPFPVDDSQVTLGTTIVSPTNGGIYREQDDIRFEGRAFSPGGRALSGEALVWFANSVGNIGTGNSFSRRLPAGANGLYLTATSGPHLSQFAYVTPVIVAAPASSHQQLQLDRGLNLIALPFDPGTTANPYRAADLLGDVSSVFVARTPDALEARARYVASVDGLALATRPLRGNEGYLIRREYPGTLDLFAKPWPAEQRTLQLRPGWQWIGIPGPATGLTSADLARLTSSAVVVETAESDPFYGARFHVWLSGAGSPPFPLRPDRGYGVLVGGRRSVVLPGGAAR